jgi:GSH-dependent disulfide-bond oxidoreductase
MTGKTAPIELYYWPTPNGWKIAIALEEMGLPYKVIPVNIGAGEQFTEEFLIISPNNRMPAIVDPDGPGGHAISVFESGAILQYLGRKTGQFYPTDERKRVCVDEWLFWQMAGLGPMAGQAHHFRQYARGVIKDQRQIAYGAVRYTNEVERLYGVLDKRLEGREFICDDYSIADMACWSWVIPWRNQGIQLEAFPDLKAWFERVGARDAAIKARAITVPKPGGLTGSEAEAERARQVLFGQRARR